MKDPLFYIIIPIYNVESYLKDCLDSVLNQSYKNFKAIMINDGSMDSSKEIAKDYTQDDRFILIDQENQGLSIARNTGLDYIKKALESNGGGYIVFLDSDDYLELNGLIVLKNIIIQNNSPEIIISNSNNYIDKESSYTNQVFFKQDENRFCGYKDILYLFPNIHFYCVWLFVYRCDFLFDNNFKFEPNIMYEDVLFTSYVFTFSNNIYISNIPIYNYRINRDGSIMNTKTKESFCKSAYSYFVLSKRFFEFYKVSDDERKKYFMYWGVFYLKETLRCLQIFGYIDEIGFSKSQLSIFYPYMSGKYKFCFHFPRIYGFPKRIRLFVTKLFFKQSK